MLIPNVKDRAPCRLGLLTAQPGKRSRTVDTCEYPVDVGLTLAAPDEVRHEKCLYRAVKTCRRSNRNIPIRAAQFVFVRHLALWTFNFSRREDLIL